VVAAAAGEDGGAGVPVVALGACFFAGVVLAGVVLAGVVFAGVEVAGAASVDVVDSVPPALVGGSAPAAAVVLADSGAAVSGVFAPNCVYVGFFSAPASASPPDVITAVLSV